MGLQNASCGKYFDEYCKIKDPESPYCIYKAHEFDEELKIFGE